MYAGDIGAIKLFSALLICAIVDLTTRPAKEPRRQEGKIFPPKHYYLYFFLM